MTTKKCTKCHQELPATRAFFYSHSTGKYGLRAACKACYLKTIREARNSDAYRKYQREYKRAYNKTTHGQAGIRHADYRRKYGITIEDYDQLLNKQGGTCAICGIVPTNKRLDVDHCHKTGMIRGLLCNICNMALGRFEVDYRVSKDSKAEFRKYLELAEQNNVVNV